MRSASATAPLGHLRAVVALDQKRDAALAFYMTRPSERIVEAIEFLEEQLFLFQRCDLVRPLGTAINTC